MDRRGSLLLVEDEDVLRMLVAQFLRAEGFAVSEAADGAEGVARFADGGPFDLLLVDLNLPHLSGVEVCRRVKKQSPGQKILICSAAIVPEHEEDLRSIGVDHLLTKPYHPDVLLAHIRQEIGPRPGSPATAPVPLLSPIRVL